ncbi:carboxymuconolactone decarboxylase family protein [Runella sp.]|uniref:carboxymuconolactone decarboxylase family protein n=1 Tax=Runella sp. TaxID=1960881 RepID=UPI003D0D38BF
MSTFTVPTKDQVSETHKVIFDNLQKALGFVPNLYATIAYSDNGLAKFLAYQNAKTSLNNKEKEIVNLIVSEVNGCAYCLAAHTVIGKMNGFSDEEILKLRSGNSSNAKFDALVKFAKEATLYKGHVDDATLNAFYAAGYTNGNLVDIILQISDKTAMNYLHNLTQVPLDFPAVPALEEVFS